MSRHMGRIGRASAVLMAVVLLAACASGPGAPSPELIQRIESARTRSDHESLAQYYDNEATQARAKADMHRRMSRAYQGTTYGVRGGPSMTAHCAATIRSFEAVASGYEGLAKGHREAAAAASQ